MPTRVPTRIRLGALSLAASALLLFLSSAIMIPLGSAASAADPRAFAEGVGSPFFALALLVHFVVGVLGIFGFFGLYCYLANSRAERWAFVGMVFCIVGFAVGLVGDGAYLALRTFGEEYLEGERGAMSALNALTESVVLAGLGFLQVLLFILFTIFYCVAIWRSGTLPQGAAVLLFGYVLLLPVNLLPVGATLGALGTAAITGLAAIGACWISLSIWRRPSSPMAAYTWPRVR